MMKDIEKSFNRAVLHSLTKRKLWITFPVLALCGVLIVFCRAVAFEVEGWMALAFVFLPILLSAGILMALGIFLMRIYYHEVKEYKVSYKEIFKGSWTLITGTSYLSVPFILIYLLLWVVLGVFMLLRQIPAVGDFIAPIMAFAPFLLIFSSIMLCLVSLVFLFFLTPALAFGTKEKFHFARSCFVGLRHNLFAGFLSFIVAMLPIIVVVGFLVLAAVVTKLSFLVAQSSLSLVVGWFFIMLPFCACLTPCVTFFFNFAAEIYHALKQK